MNLLLSIVIHMPNIENPSDHYPVGGDLSKKAFTPYP